MKLRFIVPLAVFVVLFAFFAVILKRAKEDNYNPTAIASPLLGRPAPQFELPSVEDPQVKVASVDYRDKFHLVNVWATWCVECRHEHSMLLELKRQNVIPIVGIDWNDSRERAQEWLQQLGDPYVATAFDGEGRVALDWGVYGAPETFLVDDKGIVRCKHVGALQAEDWEKKFLPVIRGERTGQCT
jgi:cytochrome c biogenesis protein CcmG, thiol:disulfide interchange protein DsbE